MIVWNPGLKLEQLEIEVIKEAFKFYKENKSSTANSLGISIRSLEMKLKKIREDDEIRKSAIEARRLKDQEFLARSRGIPIPIHHEVKAIEEQQRIRQAKVEKENKEFAAKSRGTQPAHYNMPLPSR